MVHIAIESLQLIKTTSYVATLLHFLWNIPLTPSCQCQNVRIIIKLSLTPVLLTLAMLHNM